MTAVPVDMWTDLGCPWSYVGRRRLALGFEKADPTGDLALTLHSFELNPDAKTTTISIPEIFVKKHGGTRADALAAEARVTKLANDVGLPLTVDRLASNSHKVLRVLQLAKVTGVATSWFADVQKGYFGGTLNPYDDAELTATAVAAGLDAAEVADAISSGRFDVAIDADRSAALERGATGVPFFLIGDSITVPGVASIEDYANAFRSLVHS